MHLIRLSVHFAVPNTRNSYSRRPTPSAVLNSARACALSARRLRRSFLIRETAPCCRVVVTACVASPAGVIQAHCQLRQPSGRPIGRLLKAVVQKYPLVLEPSNGQKSESRRRSGSSTAEQACRKPVNQLFSVVPWLLQTSRNNCEAGAKCPIAKLGNEADKIT